MSHLHVGNLTVRCGSQIRHLSNGLQGHPFHRHYSQSLLDLLFSASVKSQARTPLGRIVSGFGLEGKGREIESVESCLSHRAGLKPSIISNGKTDCRIAEMLRELGSLQGLTLRQAFLLPSACQIGTASGMICPPLLQWSLWTTSWSLSCLLCWN